MARETAKRPRNGFKLIARDIGDSPFCWQGKPAIWRIREGFDQTTYLDQALAVYLVLSELASDEQIPTFTTTRRKIAERSGVSIRRVSEILERFKQIKLVTWTKNFIEGTKELAPSTYTLMCCTPRTTSGTDSTRLCKNAKSKNCTVVEESIPKNLYKNRGNKGDPQDAALNGNRIKTKDTAWLVQDLERVTKAIEKTRDDEIKSALHAKKREINEELRRRGKIAKQNNQDTPEPSKTKNPRNTEPKPMTLTAVERGPLWQKAMEPQ